MEKKETITVQGTEIILFLQKKDEVGIIDNNTYLCVINN